MISVKGFVIKDSHGNIYLETVRSTRDRSISVFMEKVNTGENKNKWMTFQDSGWGCYAVTLKIDTRGTNKVKKEPENKAKVLNTNLRLPLNPNWFSLTKIGIKREDYREIDKYWITMLVSPDYAKITRNEKDAIRNLKKDPRNFFKKFTTNRVTLGYPKLGDENKTVTYEHRGIEIRTGNPELGAEPDKLYFVIKHGKQIKNQTK